MVTLSVSIIKNLTLIAFIQNKECYLIMLSLILVSMVAKEPDPTILNCEIVLQLIAFHKCEKM